ncbi:GntR family transcriptional regulator [Peribacillus castrilensis]|uniref:GntR family transcriptional regulator n=1 Tax=Peribacillus TaxID=2675229 RepID=UPI0009BCADA7|nr:GntR family transcriptional regulator [Peribacillus simplex]NCT38412.1 GntR family transcriptional regulator [Peribacillus frigoritolerans]PRA92922.1 GntR family transcriptional regulator [Peribacillus simplex]
MYFYIFQETPWKPVTINIVQNNIEHYYSKPLREAIFFVIINAIIEGIFLPGVRLTEDDIAQQFNCSRTPVCEALGNWNRKICFR